MPETNPKIIELLETRVKPIQQTLEKIIVGQKDVIKRVTMALFAVGQRDFHADGTRFLGTGHVLCEGGTGTGKCLAKNTPILMFDGSIKFVQDVMIGDLLMGPDSKPRTVISLGRGFGQMYYIIPTKGDPYKVNDEHILSLKTTPKFKGQPRQIHNVTVKDYLNRSKKFKHTTKGYRAEVAFSKKTIPIDPYFLGVWLGDGISRRPEICNINKEIIKYCEKTANSYGLSLKKREYQNRCPVWALSGEIGNKNNPLLNDLRSLNLIKNKHVPHIYKANSREIRLEILAGLLDTDGHYSDSYDFISKHKVLAEDVAYLARSLGFAAYVNETLKRATNGSKIFRKYYRVSISGHIDQIPVKIKYKKARPRQQIKDVLVTGIKIKDAGYDEYFGFEIAGPDRLFLLGDFTVTHNTVLCKSLSLLLAGNNKRVSGMPDALPSDITGCEIILLTGETKTMQGPLFCNVMLADEINRFPPKAQNAFIEALAEGCVTISNETYKLQQPFFCLATQNPTEQKGTSRLQEAISDRFMFKLLMQETTIAEKIAIARRTHHFDISSLNQIITPEQVYEAREYFFDNVYIADEVRGYCAKILHAFNHPDEYRLFEKELRALEGEAIFKQRPALNDRAMLHLEGAAMMEAIMQGRDFVLPIDVMNVAGDVLRARLLLAEASMHILMDLHTGKTETQMIEYCINEVLSKVRHN